MNKPAGWDEAQAYDGSYKALPPGGYVCVIKDAHIDEGRYGDQLVLALDICEGEYAGFYNDSFLQKKTRDPKAKWPCVFYQNVLNKKGLANEWLKGLITSVERSNPGYSFDRENYNEATLKDKVIGFVFGEEEWEAPDGRVLPITKPQRARDRESIRDGKFDIPEKKLLDKTAKSASSANAGFEQVEDELPF